MTPLCDWQIADLCNNKKDAMLEPFVDHLVSSENGKRVVSYGLSSCGYDIRLAQNFVVWQDSSKNAVGDPHNPDLDETLCRTLNVLLIQPGQHALGVSVERFRMPSAVTGICVGKSTYARLGLIVNVTPIEPAWEGHLTIELHNASNRQIAVYPNEGIAQIVFFSHAMPDVTYLARAGKYQNQPDVPVRAKL